MVVYTITVGVLGVEQWYSKKMEREAEALEAARAAAKAAEARKLKEEMRRCNGQSFGSSTSQSPSCKAA